MDSKQVALLLTVISVATVLFSQVDMKAEVSPFEAWKATHSIKFESFENTYRESIFLANLAEITLHNSKLSKSYTMGLNQFSAHTQEEFEQQFLGLNLPESVETIS